MKLIELKNIVDLAYLASSSPYGTVIQHFEDEVGNNVCFLIGGTMDETFVYYVKSEEITMKFICLDTSKDKVEYTNLPILNPRTKVIPVIEIKKQDLLDLG